jgi:hypothetical protein
MARSIKLMGMVTALGLALGAAPASALPLWSFSFPGGTSGSLGADNQYNPYDGRYFLQSGQMEFVPDTPLVPGTSATGTLQITMQLEGQVYNSTARGAQNPVPDGTVLGNFEFVMTYDNAELNIFTFGDPFVSLDVYPFNGGSGTGTLTYVNDTLAGSVDGEQEGDVIVFRTPDCSVAGISCPFSFFEWSANATSSDTATTPIDAVGEIEPVTFYYDQLAPLGSTIPSGYLSLFHGGLPCTASEPNDPNSTSISCNPVRSNFQSDEDYVNFVTGHLAGIAADARITVPEPTISALLGVGLAGIGFARRRARG